MGVNRYTTEQKEHRLSEHFTVGDFWSNPGYEWIKLDTKLAEILERFYARFGAKPRMRNQYNGKPGDQYKPVKSAGFRNSAIDWRGSRTSQHCYGRGLDFEVPGVAAYKLAQFAETIPAIGGIGLYLKKSGELERQTHIHIDTRAGSRKRWGWNNQTSGTNTPGFGGIACTFREGNKSAAIEEIQRWLGAHGYSAGTPDGIYGAKTAAAVRAFQKASYLGADGVFGAKTNAAMGLFAW